MRMLVMPFVCSLGWVRMCQSACRCCDECYAVDVLSGILSALPPGQ